MLKLLNRLASVRAGEAMTAWLMFAYSFLAMTAYNIVKPVTRSAVISDVGADNLPYLQLAAGLLIGLVMQGYSSAAGRLPRRSIVPISQAVLVGLLLVFWGLLRTGAAWVSMALFVFGLMFGLLLISQFWTLANDIYDSRQARRLFGFIGGGASLGGMAGSGVVRVSIDPFGTSNLLPLGAAALLVCLAITTVIIRLHPADHDLTLASDDRRVPGGEALRMLRESKHLRVISMMIGLAAIGAVFIEQQLNMAAEANAESTDAITLFLADVTFYLSLVGFVIQVGLTSRLHRSFGLIFALLLLPISLGLTAMAILLSHAIWAPAVARVLDTSLRYTIDKTTREVLFLPLPADLTHQAKPLIDVTMDRLAKAAGAVTLLVLIKPWGLRLSWPQISWASLVVMVAWVAAALVARREYLRTFRRSLDAHSLESSAVRFDVAEASTIDTLVEELSRPETDAVLYAIDTLETLGKLDRIPPLLLHHESPLVRARALAALKETGPGRARALLPTVRRLLDDPNGLVRAAAVEAAGALGLDTDNVRTRGFLDDADSRVAVSAAVVLADATDPTDSAAAAATLGRLAATHGLTDPLPRREVARGLARIGNPAFRTLLIPLIHDDDLDVAREAIASARTLGVSDALFVPALVSLLADRDLKSTAREALVGYGPEVVDVLAHVLMDREEPVWVRRHVPATLGRIPTQHTLDVLAAAIDEPDGFLRFKVIAAIAAVERARPELRPPVGVVERQVHEETGRYYTYLTLRYNIVQQDVPHAGALLVRALDEKLTRTLDRIFRLLALLHPWRDVTAARVAFDEGDARARARALEYLDNVLAGPVRRRVMPILDTAPLAEKVRHANSVLRTRPRDVLDTVAQLIHEDDPVVAASAIHFAVGCGLAEDLRSDLEFVSERRRADALAVAAANWALQSMGNASRVSVLPTVGVVDRLRAIPLFARVSIDELFRVAANATLIRPESKELYRQGAAAEEVLLLLEGAVTVVGGDPPREVVAAPAALNLLAALEGRALRQSVEVTAPILALTLPASVFLTMLADNIATAQGLFQMLLSSRTALDWTAPVEPRNPDDAGPADAVERAWRLRRTPLFSRATPDQLNGLVAAMRETALVSGTTLWGDGVDPAIYHLLRGEVTLESTNGQPGLVAGPGSTLGLAETLTGSASIRRPMVTSDGLALRLGHDELYDILADDSGLLQSLFSGVFSAGGSEHIRSSE